LKVGTFLLESERTGYKHLYRCKSDGSLQNAVTQGPWQITNILRIDEEAQAVFFMGTKDGSVGQNAYRADLSGENLLRLTPGRGSHRVTLDAKGNTLLSQVSNLKEPPKQLLVDARTGELKKVLVTGSMPAAEKTYGLSLPELVRIPCRDGFEIDAAVTKPLPFDEDKTYPVWIETYSGPAAASVRDSFSVEPWFQFLAQQGIIVFQVNVRSAANTGQVHTATCYRQFGVQELRDMDDAVDWLCKNPWADKERVGMTGWSYGGFMTAFALTNSTKYRMGIAGAGVYDWRLYDTIYTERYMATPQNNEEGYRQSSVVESAKNLHGHLLIIHGTMDDNVHLQNAMQLVYALERAGKDFELMLYPKSRHGVAEPGLFMHHRKLVWKTIQNHLLN
jgi:dipeptidyl-peptidase-4